MEGPLLQLRNAIQQPGLASAWDASDLEIGHSSMPKRLAERIAAQWIAGTMTVEMHRGRLNEASEDLHSLATFAAVERENPSEIQQNIRVHIARLSLVATWELLQTNGWSDAQLARMQADLEPLNLVAGTERGLIGSRAVFLDQMESAPQNGGRVPFPNEPVIDRIKYGAIVRLWDPSDDQLFYLQNTQSTLESLRALAARQPRAKTRDRFEQNAVRLAEMGTLTKYRYLFSLIALPNMNKSIETVLRVETERELAMTAIALKRFQLRHNRPAPDLASLVPEFLSTLPYDPMSGSPLKYRLNADGSFVLYSVGEDGKDDGGDSAVARPEAVRDMWRGRDALWPAPVW
jgi:hypothetical protein